MPNTFTSLRKLQQRGFNPRHIIDGGAAGGWWTNNVLSIWPDARYMLCEPRAKIGNEVQASDNLIRCNCLIGNRNEFVSFNESNDQSSMFNNAAGEMFGTQQTYQMVTIDRLVAHYRFAPVDLIKLDVQGAELLALEGAQETLKTCQFIQLEAQVIQTQHGFPSFVETIVALDGWGFQLYELGDELPRPLDGALGQLDLIFIRKDHPFVSDRRWAVNSVWS